MDGLSTTPMGMAKESFSKALHASIEANYPDSKVSIEDVEKSIEVLGSHADISSSIAFKLSGILKRSPMEIAKILASNMKKPDYLSGTEASGAYVNARFDNETFSRLVLSEISKFGDKYGARGIGAGAKAIVEYPSVNPNKPWHIGHLRNALLGDSISRIMAFCSYIVERVDYIDDLGLQMAESVWGWQNLSSKPDKKFDQWLGEEYVNVNRKIENEAVKAVINDILRKMEEGNNEESRLSREIAEKCVSAQYETAKNYHISHDIMIWESDIVKENLLKNALEIALKSGVAVNATEGKYAGCIIANVKSFANLEEGAKVLVRSNGTATYIAKDIAFHMWKLGIINRKFKFEKFNAEQYDSKPIYSSSQKGAEADFGNAAYAINIIGAAQEMQQEMLKSIFDSVQKSDKKIIHISYGEVGIEGGNLSGRKGGWLGKGSNYTADDLLKETKRRSLEIISGEATNEIEKEKIADHVAISAIKMEFLKYAPEKQIIFSWQRALDINGNSGPYCMYTYARASKVLGKEEPEPLEGDDYKTIGNADDFVLIKKLGNFPDMVEKACREYRPTVLAEYIMDVSYSFNAFYEKMQILKGGEAKKARLAITASAVQVLKNCMGLLGIDVLGRI